jgi:penicillin amidase
MTPEDLKNYKNVPFEERPHLVNPQEGFVVSANQKPENSPQLNAGYFQPEDRYRTIRELLQVKEKWSLEELKVLQTANNNIFFGPYRDAIIEATTRVNYLEGSLYESALETLKKWELNSPKESGESLLFYSFFNKFQRTLLEGMSDDEFNLYCDTNYLYHYAKRELLSGEKKEVIAKSFKAAVDELRDKFGPMTHWQLGEKQTLTLGHPLSRASELLASFLNVGPFQVDGGYNQVNNMRPVGCRNGMQVKAGPSTRRLISLNNTRESWGVLPLGNSGHYGSPFFKNQFDLFFSGEYRPQLMRELQPGEVYSKLTFLAK